MMPEARLFGVLVTFRRPDALATMLEKLADQDRSIDHLFVVDNAPDDRNRALVASYADRGFAATYVPSEQNTGPAGGIRIGMERVLEVAEGGDWVLLLDDDDPPWESDWVGSLWTFAGELDGLDPAVAGVGTGGSRFDRRRGRLVRPADRELEGAVPVDVIGGNQFPLYRVKAIREVGPFRWDLFFGFDDLEFGLRLRAAGWTMYTLAQIQLERRRRQGRLGLAESPSVAVRAVGWRSYYSLRNLIWICRSQGWRGAALRVSLVHGLAKPAMNLFGQPRQAWQALRLNGRACVDAWRGRLGRTVDPAIHLDGSYGSRPRPRVREA
jgi:glycosyltransferase involved in cell wall biosynthesis